jgi:hypothetical protein
LARRKVSCLRHDGWALDCSRSQAQISSSSSRSRRRPSSCRLAGSQCTPPEFTSARGVQGTFTPLGAPRFGSPPPHSRLPSSHHSTSCSFPPPTRHAYARRRPLRRASSLLPSVQWALRSLGSVPSLLLSHLKLSSRNSPTRRV